MGSALNSQAVVDALRDLRALGEREDALYRQAVHAREVELGVTLGAADRTAFAVNAPLAISRQVGEVLHAIVLAMRPKLIVEFGASLGISTIYLASALDDLRAGLVLTTELVASKAQRTEIMLQRAGLGAHVEVRAGDALQTLGEIPAPVDLLFLDGANHLYLDVLKLIRPHLSPHISMQIALDAGLVISTPASD